LFEPGGSRNGQESVWMPAVNVPSANNARTMSAVASALIICFTFATNARYIVNITAVHEGYVSGQAANAPPGRHSLANGRPHHHFPEVIEGDLKAGDNVIIAEGKPRSVISVLEQHL
jgi:hypothetical protein